MAKFKWDTLIFWLIAIGALNLGLVAALNFDLVGTILGTYATYAYYAVGIAAAYVILGKLGVVKKKIDL